MSQSLFSQPLNVINVGIAMFSDDLKKQHVEVTQLDWTPPGQWFTGPAQQVIGPMFAGYKPEDSGLDIGDSAITETYGIGGFAMATAPAIVALVGGTVEEAIDFSRQMREITLGENPNVTIPLLGFMGVPSAIDITRVGSSGILPVINTAIAHKDAGVGMIGAGIVHPPFACFEKAILGWCERYGV